MRLTTYSERRLNENILSRPARMTYKANTIFYNRGEQAWKAYYLEKGLVKLSLISRDGNQRSPVYITAGSMFGEYGLVSNSYGATAIAVVDCEVVPFNKEQFARLISEDFIFVQLCISSLVEKLQGVVEQYNAASFMDRFGKVANGLSCLARRWGESVLLTGTDGDVTECLRLRITHQELAEFSGVTRTTVTTVLSALEAKKIIQKRAKEIIVLNLKELERWVM